jgi:uncharacterized protein (DUF1697 family)
MRRYVTLLRAVNVGGAGALAMSALKALFADAGFDRIETYIASANVVFDSKDDAAGVKSKLGNGLPSSSARISAAVRTNTSTDFPL